MQLKPIALSLLLLGLGGACSSAGSRAVRPSAPVAAVEPQLGRSAIERMAGCYLVDYNYHETKALKPQYALDPRVYDPNNSRTVMEWIVALGDKPNQVRLQHVLFILDEAGALLPHSMIRHQAEDWEFEPAWVWEYQGDSHWRKVEPANRKGQWVRRITHLDDGLRYQCLAPWRTAGQRAEWTCGDNFSPIPGRETRDMKRTDYQALLRESRLVVFPTSWVERQKNVKTIVQSSQREPLAEEVGRNWFIRVDDAQCAQAARWTTEHLPFWNLLKDTWATYFESNSDWREPPPGKGPPRWSKIVEVEERYLASAGSGKAETAKAQQEVREIIEADRVKPALEGEGAR